MKVIAFEGVVENGCIKVPADISVPENTKVYIVVPTFSDEGVKQTFHIRSPRLVNPEDASAFIMEVSDINDESRPKT
jgi:hypothetical protein